MTINVGLVVGDDDMGKGGAVPYASRLASIISGSQMESGLSVSLVRSLGSERPHGIVVKAIDRTMDLVISLVQRGVGESRVYRRRRVPKHLLGIDLVHIPYQSVPPCFDSVPYVVTVHDVQELHYPQYFTAEQRAWRAVANAKAIRDAKAIVVSFQHVKNDLMRFFQCSDEKVFVAPLPFEACLLKKAGVGESLVLAERYEALGRFVLYPAQTWEHKNHVRLIDAFDAARQRLHSKFSLVCTGHVNPYFASHIEPRIKASPYSESIHFLGVVPETELRWLYERSDGVVIPTLYEAGSFPLVEAMSLGVPVVCANTTSLPAMVGDERFVFNPWNVDSIADAMSRIVEDEAFRSESSLNGGRRFRQLCNADVSGFFQSLWMHVGASL